MINLDNLPVAFTVDFDKKIIPSKLDLVALRAMTDAYYDLGRPFRGGVADMIAAVGDCDHMPNGERLSDIYNRFVASAEDEDDGRLAADITLSFYNYRIYMQKEPTLTNRNKVPAVWKCTNLWPASQADFDVDTVQRWPSQHDDIDISDWVNDWPSDTKDSDKHCLTPAEVGLGTVDPSIYPSEKQLAKHAVADAMKKLATIVEAEDDAMRIATGLDQDIKEWPSSFECHVYTPELTPEYDGLQLGEAEVYTAENISGSHADLPNAASCVSFIAGGLPKTLRQQIKAEDDSNMPS